MLILLLVFCILCTSCSVNKAQRAGKEGDSIVVMLTGDVLLDRGVKPFIQRHGVAWLFEEVQSYFQQADATIINLECPLTAEESPLGKQYIFRAEPAYAKELRTVGITHAAMANNHTNDQGYQGVASTYHALQDAGITPLGCGRGERDFEQPILIEKGKVRIAVFNAVLFSLENWVPVDNDSTLVPCQTDVNRVAKWISRYREVHPEDKILCVMHWGVEFHTSPSMQQWQQAHALIHAGADAIVGHHPHVLQPLRYVQGKPVVFSLGNFVFDQHHPEAKKSGIARFVFREDTTKVEVIPLKINGVRPTML